MKTIIGILLMPISVSMAMALGRSLAQWNFLEQHQFLVAAGFFAYVVLHFALYRPLFAYVMAHELSHAVWAWILGREIGEVSVKSEGGHVMVGGPNAFIALVPYFFPFYSVLVLILIQIAKPGAVPYLMFFLGATLSFHVILTVTMLLRPQSDLQGTGHVFGLSVIFFMNVVVMSGLSMWLFPSVVQFASFLSSSWRILLEWYQGFITLLSNSLL